MRRGFLPKGHQVVPDHAFARCARAGMTRAQAAKELGVTPITVTRWKRQHPHIKWIDGRAAAAKALMQDPEYRAKAVANLKKGWQPDDQVTPLWRARRRRVAMVERAFAVQGHDTFTEIGFGKRIRALAAKEAAVAAEVYRRQRLIEPEHEWWLDQDDLAPDGLLSAA